MDRKKKTWINLIFLVVTLLINTLGAVGWINGMTQKEISDKYVTLITPGPATFSIWSVIYSLLIISLVVMIIKKDDTYYQKAAEQLSVIFWISCLFNIGWIVTFSYELIGVSVLFILGLVVTLTFILFKLLRLREGRRWLLPLSFGLYTGWLFIAAAVNIAAWFVKLGWNGFGIAASIWAIVILIIAALLVIFVLLKNRNCAYPLPVAWAYFGIYQFLRAPEGFDREYALVEIVALIGMVVLIGAAAIQLYKNHFAVLPPPEETQPK